MFFKLIYKCFYFNISLINEFNKIKTFIIFEPISLRFDRFDITKKTIKKNPSNECTIKIIIKRAIYISFTKSGFEIITRKEEIELLSLLQRVEISSLLIKD